MPRYESPYDPSTMPDKLEHVIYDKKGHVAYVTINRPEVRNALHSYAYAELRACWRDIGLDPDIYVGMVTGTGEAFCAGRDVKFLASYQARGKRTPHEDPNDPLFHWGGGGQPSDANLEKPLIAAINGFAVGVGLSLALQCQLRVMADTAWIGDSSPLAVQAAVRLYRLAAAFPPPLVSYAAHLDQEVAESEDGAEGPRAFREKRKPAWKMR
jgi:enoyl-CoA hydratase/carnithine racemase